MLQYDNWTDKQVETECFRQPVGQKSVLKIVKFEKMVNLLVEFGSESGSSYIGPFQEREYYTNVNFYEFLLKAHYVVNFERV